MVPASPFVTRSAASAVGALLLALTACAEGGGDARGRAAQASAAPRPVYRAPTAPAPAPTPPAAPTVAPAPRVAAPPPNTLPALPPGATTSDRGQRQARPTPLGQIAPEEPPAAGGRAP